MKALNTKTWIRRLPKLVLALVFSSLLLPQPCWATPPPTFLTQPVSQSVPLNGTVSFSTTVSSSTTPSYQWYKNGSPITLAILSSYTINNAQTNDQANYTVKVTNLGGSVASTNAALTVLGPPEITAQPVSQTVTPGQSFSFSVAANGTAPLSYQWIIKGTRLSGATSSTLTINSVRTSDAGSYTVVVTNSAGAVTSAVATLTVLVPPTITTPPQSQTVVAGQSATFSVAASGTGPLLYQWCFSGTPLAGATNSTLQLTNVRAANAGSYMVVVTNTWGFATNASALLTTTNPSIVLSSDAGAGMGMTPAGFSFQFSVPAGATYVVLASSDFMNWAPIATNVTASGSVVFTDTNAANYGQRIYRLMLP